MDLASLKSQDLLALHAQIGEELRKRNITRSHNNPTGDLAEVLFCKAFGWAQSGNSNPNVDAIDASGVRYQIKGRRITAENGSRQLSAIRDLHGAHFDFLAAVLFSVDYKVSRAAIIPWKITLERASFVEHTNSHKFILRDDVWSADGVRDVTTELLAVSL